MRSLPVQCRPRRFIVSLALLATLSPASPAAAADPTPSALLRVRGAKIVDGAGHVVALRGVAFGNEVWSNARLPRRHHDETDYQRVAAMGMNAVRFYMNYRTFESDAAPGKYLDDGWQWLADNIAWAKKHGVYLVLNMHVPPGGFQSLGAGKALWARADLQDRFVRLWTEIARRCRNEPTVAGYDLLNEPVVTKSKSQWSELAGRIAAAIRTVDPDHMLFVERVNAVGGDWSEDADRNFFTIADPNTVYEFHFYKPFHFTHQSASWSASPPRTCAIPTTAPRSSGSCSTAAPPPTTRRSCRPATRPGRTTRARRFTSRIRRSSSASRCWR
jgi:endoglucanase